MRERRTFAERTKLSESDMTLKRYYLVYEGTKTEQIYFDAINNMRKDIGINPLIELVPLIRSYSEEGWSNPKQILDRVIENLEESKTGCISYETLLNRIMDVLVEEEIISTSKIEAKSVWTTLTWICEVKLEKLLIHDVLDVTAECNEIVKILQEKSIIKNVIPDISSIIIKRGLTYAEEIDKICLIVDRDSDSFIAKLNNDQYAYVLNKCKEKNFGFYITNPCFEFWLLLHFDKVFELDKKQLLTNSKVTKTKNYVEKELSNILKGYKKSSYSTEMLLKNIDKAILNEKKFCEDIRKLENTVGSNIGVLIEEMRGNDE